MDYTTFWFTYHRFNWNHDVNFKTGQAKKKDLGARLLQLNGKYKPLNQVYSRGKNKKNDAKYQGSDIYMYIYIYMYVCINAY